MYFNTNNKLNGNVADSTLIDGMIKDLESKKDLEKFPVYISTINSILQSRLETAIVDITYSNFLLSDFINVIANNNIKVNAKYALFLQDLHNDLYTEEVVTFAKYNFIKSDKLDRTFKVNVTTILTTHKSLQDELIFILKKNGLTELCYVAKNIVEYLNISGRHDD